MSPRVTFPIWQWGIHENFILLAYLDNMGAYKLPVLIGFLICWLVQPAYSQQAGFQGTNANGNGGNFGQGQPNWVPNYQQTSAPTGQPYSSYGYPNNSSGTPGWTQNPNGNRRSDGQLPYMGYPAASNPTMQGYAQQQQQQGFPQQQQQGYVANQAFTAPVPAQVYGIPRYPSQMNTGPTASGYGGYPTSLNPTSSVNPSNPAQGVQSGFAPLQPSSQPTSYQTPSYGSQPGPIPARPFMGLRTGGTEIDKRWSRGQMPLKVFLQPGDGIPRYKPNFYEVVKHSFEEWTNTTNGAVRFEVVDSAEGSDIQVEWVEYCRDIGHQTADGVTQLYYDAMGNIKSAHIFLATTMPNRYLQGKQDSHTMRATSLHEIGHALGLSHSPRSSDIMYFQNHSRQRIMVQGIIPINIPLPAGISGNDKRRVFALYGGQTPDGSN